MKLNKTWKMVIGILTAWIVLYPFVAGALYFLFIFVMLLSNPQNDTNPPVGFFLGLFLFMGIFMLSGLLQLIMSIFYLLHVIKNKTGSEILRDILGIGSVYMPFLAMPIYYFIFIWPESIPAWALEKTKEEII